MKSTNYFSHDSNARNDEKLVRLRMRHSAAGYGVYFMILERLREETDYVSVKDYNVIAFDLRVDASLIKSVVEDFGLFVFTEDGKYFYSESLLKRMSVKDNLSKKRSEAGKVGNAKRWKSEISENNNRNCNENLSQTHRNCDINTSQEKKEKKEIKKKECKEKSAAIAATHTHENSLEEEKLKARMATFKQQCAAYVERYGRDMMSAFYGYWSEPTHDGRMRWELERTWDIPRRLAAWQRNEKRTTATAQNAPTWDERTIRTERQRAAARAKASAEWEQRQANRASPQEASAAINTILERIKKQQRDTY